MDEAELFAPWPGEAGAPEVKSAGGEGALSALLNDLTIEMRREFDLHRRLREAAAAWLEREEPKGEELESEELKGEARDADGAAAKAARADLKAVGDAMQVIVRILEKIDTLQRQLARDRADRDDRAAVGDEAALRRKVETLIEARAQERARDILAVRADRAAAKAGEAGGGSADGEADTAGGQDEDDGGASAGGGARRRTD